MNILNISASIKEIKKLHGDILNAARTTLPKAIKIGELLTGIKDKTGHGHWLPWIEKNLPFSERTAQNYIRCFDEKDRLKSANVADLSSAYLLLSETKAEPADSEFMSLDTRIRQAFTDAKETVALYPAESGLSQASGMDARITEAGFDGFIRQQGITLADGDLIALTVIGKAYEDGATLTGGTILEILNRFNPARNEVLAA
ncbi:MAG: DUF3102 domain-containing protein [Formivibrio sp.]|nr:DUF3102 domain-containing protein [Formivibrio sp.]